MAEVAGSWRLAVGFDGQVQDRSGHSTLPIADLERELTSLKNKAKRRSIMLVLSDLLAPVYIKF